MIFNSFKYSRISCSLDRSEDGISRGYEDLQKGIETIEINHEEGSDQEDEYVTSSIHQISISLIIKKKDFNHRIYKLSLKVFIFAKT